MPKMKPMKPNSMETCTKLVDLYVAFLRQASSLGISTDGQSLLKIRLTDEKVNRINETSNDSEIFEILFESVPEQNVTCFKNFIKNQTRLINF